MPTAEKTADEKSHGSTCNNYRETNAGLSIKPVHKRNYRSEIAIFFILLLFQKKKKKIAGIPVDKGVSKSRDTNFT